MPISPFRRAKDDEEARACGPDRCTGIPPAKTIPPIPRFASGSNGRGFGPSDRRRAAFAGGICDR
jgi:hypothetical protein